MSQRPPAVRLGRRWRWAWLLWPAAALLLSAVILGLVATRSIRPPWRQFPNPAHQYDAARKLRIFEESMRLGRRGYVRFSEVELNSYAGDWLAQRRAAVEDAEELPSRICFELGADRVNIYCWFDEDILGGQKEIAWIRTYQHRAEGESAGRWEMVKLRCGGLTLPRQAWGRPLRRLAGADILVAGADFDWVLTRMNCGLRMDSRTGLAELKLHTGDQGG